MALREWVKLPSEWIEDGGLRQLRWRDGEGADNTAALMTLAALAHHADDESGAVRLTYDQLSECIGLSRSKLAGGLRTLQALNVISRNGGRSLYRLNGYDPRGGWAKLPAKALYTKGRIVAFDEFKLRRPAELHALKLYFLFAARRGRNNNMANISYEKIEEYAGIERHRIKPALSILVLNSLVHVEQLRSSINEYGISNGYRLVGLDTRNHMGTRGRSDASALFNFHLEDV